MQAHASIRALSDLRHSGSQWIFWKQTENVTQAWQCLQLTVTNMNISLFVVVITI